MASFYIETHDSGILANQLTLAQLIKKLLSWPGAATYLPTWDMKAHICKSQTPQVIGKVDTKGSNQVTWPNFNGPKEEVIIKDRDVTIDGPDSTVAALML